MDPDGNGVNNLAEYALGIPHGLGARTGLPTMDASSGILQLSYQPLRTDVIYQPEWSNDLLACNTSGFTTTTTGSTSTVSLPVGANERIFMRLKIIQD